MSSGGRARRRAPGIRTRLDCIGNLCKYREVTSTDALADELLRSAARLSRWASRHADLGPARVTALAAADDCSQPSMTAQVHRLEADGLVARTPDPGDARATLIGLTADGAAALFRLRRARGAALAPLLDAVHPDPGRLRDAVDLLSELLDAAQREPTTCDRKDT